MPNACCLGTPALASRGPGWENVCAVSAPSALLASSVTVMTFCPTFQPCVLVVMIGYVSFPQEM